MECEFCKKELKNISSLNNHKKTAKYCLKIQGNITTEIFECKFCKKEFTTKQHLVTHSKICKKKEEIDYKTFMKNKEKEISFLKSENNKLKIQLNEKNLYIAKIEAENELYKEDHNFIKEIAKQPKNVNTTNNNNKILNITSNIDFNDKEKIKELIENNYNINYVLDGQKGFAQFAKDNLLKDGDGNLIYVCTDPSRYIFKYKDETGEIKKDIEAKKITAHLIDGGIKQKSIILSSDWYTKENGEIDMERLNIILKKQESILSINDDNSIFKKELAAITTL